MHTYMTVLTLLTHALPMIAPANDKHWEILEKSQRFAARLATNNFRSPYANLLRSLHWKPIARLCTERQLLTIHKWRNGMRFLPDFVLMEHRLPRRNLHNLHDSQLTVNDHQHGRLRGVPIRVQVKEAPLFYAIEAWNLLPRHLPVLPFNEFKREIRKFETFSVLEERAPNVYNGRITPPLASGYNNI